MALSLPQPLRHRGGVAARARPGGIDRTAGGAPSSSTPTRAAARWPTTSPTAYQLRLRVRRAVGVRRHRGGQPSGRRRPRQRRWSQPVLRPTSSSRPRYEPRRARACSIGKRKNTRVLEAPAARPRRAATCARSPAGSSCRSRTASSPAATTWRVVTGRQPTDEQWRDAELAWRMCGHVKSNAIVLVKDGQAVGIGAGQQNRVDAGQLAAEKAAGRAKGGAARQRRASSRSADGLDAAAAGRRRRGGPAGGLDARRGGHRRGRRARPRHGVHRRTALPALSRSDHRSTAPRWLADGHERELAGARSSELPRRGGSRAGSGHRSSSATTRPARPTSASSTRTAPSSASRSLRQHLPADARRPRCTRSSTGSTPTTAVDAYLVQVPVARKGLDDGGRPARGRPRQGRRRAAPGQPRPAGDGESPGRCPCTPAGIQALLVHYDVPIEGRHVVDRRPGPHHRPSAGAAARAQAPQRQRRGDRGAHRRARPGRLHPPGRRRGRRGRRGRVWSRPTWSSRARRWSARA